MPRDFQIFGEALVFVRGGAHIGFNSRVQELGLCSDSIRIDWGPQHEGMLVDDYGPTIPADIMWQLEDVHIHMTLIHYDPVVLTAVMHESFVGGARYQAFDPSLLTPRVARAGILMGNGLPLYASGNHYMSVGIQTGGLGTWTFYSCYLTGRPLEIPVGTRASMVKLDWRAIPYRAPVSGRLYSSGQVSGYEYSSSGVELWDQLLLT